MSYSGAGLADLVVAPRDGQREEADAEEAATDDGELTKVATIEQEADDWAEGELQTELERADPGNLRRREAKLLEVIRLDCKHVGALRRSPPTRQTR